MNLVSLIIDKFLENIHGITGCLVTEDGLVVAKGMKYADNNTENLGVITSSMLCVAERGVDSIKNNLKLKQFSIETSLSNNDQIGDIISVLQIHRNVWFAFNYSRNVETGLVNFELNQVIKQLRSIFEKEGIQILENIGTMI